MAGGYLERFQVYVAVDHSTLAIHTTAFTACVHRKFQA
jgi:hypothetical protein